MSGCVGVVGEAGDASTEPDASEPLVETEQVAPNVLRRLTRTEYRNTIRDLFGVESLPIESLPADGTNHGFATTAGQLVAASALSKYLDMAAMVRAAIEPDPSRVFSCAPGGDEMSCVRAFLTSPGTRIFRRPLRAEEQAHYEELFVALRAEFSVEESLLTVLEAMLVAPQFLFLPEERPDGIVEGDSFPLDDWQLATRISYALWQTTPDEPLLQAASEGSLRGEGGVEAHVTRMIADPRARDTIRAFSRQWLALDLANRVLPAPDKGITEEVIADLREETERHVEYALFEAEHPLEELFLSSRVYRSAALSTLYNDGLSSGAELSSMDAPVTPQRFGLLSQAGFLASRSPNPEAAIIHRGLFVRERFLCQQIPFPPPGAAGSLPALSPDLTDRERVQEHTGASDCQGCHALINSPGFALESFDSYGLWRDDDDGRPIDARTIISQSDLGEVDGAHDLSVALTESADVKRCLVEQLFQFAMMRGAGAGELGPLAEEVAESEVYRFEAVLGQLMATEAFRSRREMTEIRP